MQSLQFFRHQRAKPMGQNTLSGSGKFVLSFQMTSIDSNEKENTLHPVGLNFLVQCVGYRGWAHRNGKGQWKTIFSDLTLPTDLSFIPPFLTTLPAFEGGQQGWFCFQR